MLDPGVEFFVIFLKKHNLRQNPLRPKGMANLESTKKELSGDIRVSWYQVCVSRYITDRVNFVLEKTEKWAIMKK